MLLWFRACEWWEVLLCTTREREKEPFGQVEGFLDEPYSDLWLEVLIGTVSGFVSADSELVKLVTDNLRNHRAKRVIVQHVVQIPVEGSLEFVSLVNR